MFLAGIKSQVTRNFKYINVKILTLLRFYRTRSFHLAVNYKLHENFRYLQSNNCVHDTLEMLPSLSKR
jgi:hypothetical protein